MDMFALGNGNDCNAIGVGNVGSDRLIVSGVTMS